MNKIKIDDTCVSCGKCVEVCPAHILEIENKAKVVKPNICLSCAHCAIICPINAIHSIDEDNHRSFKATEVLGDVQGVAQVLKTKRSIRRYKESPLDDVVLQKIIEYANYAPSASNQRRRKYIVVTDKTLLWQLESHVMKLIKLISRIIHSPLISLVGLFNANLKESAKAQGDNMQGMIQRFEKGEGPVFRNAPCIVFFLGKKGTPLSGDDAIIAQQYAMLYAHSIGVGSCIIGFAVVAKKFINKCLNVPKGYEIKAASVFGYPEFTYKKGVLYDKDAEVIWK